jgi:hypothetical protein
VGSETNGLFQGTWFGRYALSETASLSGTASFFLRDEVRNEFQPDELNITFTNTWLKATLGSERPNDNFGGLGTVQEDFLLSGNARALPGVILEASNPLNLFKDFQLDWGIAHYELTDNRFITNANLHYKRLGLIWKAGPRLSLHGTISHYAQWGGFSPELGQQANGFSDFIDVFMARRGGDSGNDSDQANAAGNHLGLYEFEVVHSASYGTYNFYHQHPLEDGSGTRLKNFPDGIWGFYYKPNTIDYTSFFKGFLVEYVQTTNQSGNSGDSGRDNYFRSGIYRSGWTYDGNILGLPFISMDETGLEIGVNRVRAVHIGLQGGMNKWFFTTKISLVENQGSFARPINPVQKVLYTYAKVHYDLEDYGALELHAGADFGDLINDTYGAALRYIYSF